MGERKVKALNIVRDGEVIHTVKIQPPIGEFSGKVDTVTRGLLGRIRHDETMFVEEVYVDEDSD